VAEAHGRFSTRIGRGSTIMLDAGAVHVQDTVAVKVHDHADDHVKVDVLGRQRASKADR
jgi:hypothetical protein